MLATRLRAPALHLPLPLPSIVRKTRMDVPAHRHLNKLLPPRCERFQLRLFLGLRLTFRSFLATSAISPLQTLPGVQTALWAYLQLPRLLPLFYSRLLPLYVFALSISSKSHKLISSICRPPEQRVSLLAAVASSSLSSRLPSSRSSVPESVSFRFSSFLTLDFPLSAMSHLSCTVYLYSDQGLEKLRIIELCFVTC